MVAGETSSWSAGPDVAVLAVGSRDHRPLAQQLIEAGTSVVSLSDGISGSFLSQQMEVGAEAGALAHPQLHADHALGRSGR